MYAVNCITIRALRFLTPNDIQNSNELSILKIMSSSNKTTNATSATNMYAKTCSEKRSEEYSNFRYKGQKKQVRWENCIVGTQNEN